MKGLRKTAYDAALLSIVLHLIAVLASLALGWIVRAIVAAVWATRELVIVVPVFALLIGCAAFGGVKLVRLYRGRS